MLPLPDNSLFGRALAWLKPYGSRMFSAALRPPSRGEGRPEVLRFRVTFYLSGGVALLGVYLAGLAVPVEKLFVLIGFSALTSPLSARWLRPGDGPATSRRRSALLTGLLAYDVAALSVLLAFTGGIANPFTLLYFVQVTLAAVSLPPAGTAVVVGSACIGYGSLFLWEDAGATHSHQGAYSHHLQGMWVAFCVTAFFVGAFVSRLTQAFLREREMRERTARLLGLTTLAAGAAHEIGNPLGTIKLVAADLARELEAAAEGETSEPARDTTPLVGSSPAVARQVGTWAADARVIVEEVDRARGVLDRMALGAGALTGEGLRWVTAEEIVRGLDAWLGACPLQVDLEPSAARASLWVPVHATTHALAQLLRNAFDASPDAPVSVRVEADSETVRYIVTDTGKGMSPEVLERLGEPFFTTKPAGEGMGLGLFLAHALAEALGGHLHFRSAPGRGTEAILVLPLGRAQPLVARAEGPAARVRGSEMAPGREQVPGVDARARAEPGKTAQSSRARARSRDRESS